MKRFIGVALVGLALGARPAAGQLVGIPTYFSPKGGTGIMLSGDFGRAASTKINGVTAAAKPSAIGGRASLGLPFITVGVGAAIYDPKTTTSNSEIQYSGTLAFKVFGAPLVPVAVSAQVGAGYLKVGSGVFAATSVNVPIGIGVALNVPTPGASIEPWAAARVHLNSVSSGTTRGTQLGYGASGGVNFGLPIGLGFHVAADWSTYPAKLGSPVLTQHSKVERLVIGLGLHYMIKLPGLPGVPIVPGV